MLLSVLVDVIGTNLSRTDYGVAYRDDLGASCELTYYAINPKNQVIMSPSKSAAGLGHYEETNVRFSPIRLKDRSVSEYTETIVPTLSGSNLVEEAPEVDLKTNGKTSVSSRLDELYQRALIQLEANNRKGAEATINAIRLLNPKYQFLPELEQSLAEL